MSGLNVGFAPIGVPTFHLESARKELKKSIEMLKSIHTNIDYPDDILLSVDDLCPFLKDKNFDLIIVQNTTFANSDYMQNILRYTDCYVVLWTLREPVIDGDRLRLNSLTGAYSAGNILKNMNREFSYVFGSPNEDEVRSQMACLVKSAKVVNDLKELRIASVGHTPQGFGFGRALDTEITKNFGSSLISVELRELVNKAKSYSLNDCDECSAEITNTLGNIENVEKKNVDDFIKLYKAYYDFVKEEGIGALATRCWPDFFVDYGTPVCSVLAMLNDNGIMSSCEGDVYGALSMFIGYKFSNKAVFFGDPVSLDEKQNTITFWHCGMAACSLARDNVPNIGVHPNRKIGPTMEFGCKPSEKATIFRVGKTNEGKFRFFIATGEILDLPKQFCGASLVFKTDNDAKNVVKSSIIDGFEPHFAIIYDDIESELIALSNMLGIQVCLY